MRTKGLYVTYDNVSKVFGSMVFPAYNHDDALRGFTQLISKNTDIRKDDLSLYYLGLYDRIDGKIIPSKEAELIKHGRDIEL